MHDRIWTSLLVPVILASFGLVGGCRSGERTSQWQTYRYSESDVLTPEQQMAAQRDLQADSSALTKGPLGVPPELLSNTMTEQQRQSIQQEYGRALRERAEQQRRVSEALRAEVERMAQQDRASGSQD
jgi:hypothetical protein